MSLQRLEVDSQTWTVTPTPMVTNLLSHGRKLGQVLEKEFLHPLKCWEESSPSPLIISATLDWNDFAIPTTCWGPDSQFKRPTAIGLKLRTRCGQGELDRTTCTPSLWHESCGVARASIRPSWTLQEKVNVGMGLCRTTSVVHSI